MVTNVAQLIISLGSGALIARALGPEGKGQLFLILQIASMGGLLLSLGLGPSYQYHLGKERFSRAALISHCFFQIGLIAVILWAAYSFGLEGLRVITGQSLSNGLIAATLGLVVLNVATLTFGCLLMGMPDGVRRGSLYSVIGGGVYIGALGTILVGLKWGIVGALCATAAGWIVRTLFVMRPVMDGAWIDLAWPDAKMSRVLLGYGMGSLMGNLMLTSVLRIDTFILNIYGGAAAVGIYSVAVSTGELLLLIPGAIGVAFFPYLTALKPEDQVDAMCFVARANLILGLIGSVALAALGYPFLLVVFGGRFTSAFVPLLWLLPGLIAMTVNYSYANFFSSRGEPMLNASIFGIGAVLNIGINLMLIPRFGITGAAIASSVAYSAISFGFIFLIGKRTGASFHELAVPKISDIGQIARKLGALVLEKVDA